METFLIFVERNNVNEQSAYHQHQFDFLGAVALFVGLLVGLGIVGIYTFIALQIMKVSPEVLQSNMLYTIISYVFTLLFPIMVYNLIAVRIKGQRLRFNFKSSPFKVYLLVFPLMFGMMLISEYFTELIPTEGPLFGDWYKTFTDTISTMAEDSLGIIILTSLMAPLLEEILFRGIIQKGLINRGMKPINAIVLSAFIFGAFHMNPWQFVGAFLLGLVLGLVYYRTQSLLMAILLHAFNNFISSLMIINTKTENFGDFFKLPEIIILILGAIIFSVFYYLFMIKSKVKTI